MTIIQRQLVRINWDGPFTVEQVKNRDYVEATEHGIYQIYGNHVIFGPNSLLYIGKAEDQSFSCRIGQHLDWLINFEGISIYLGTINDEDFAFEPEDDRWTEWRQLLRKVESYTIWWHSPPCNSSNINTHSLQNTDTLHVQNWGKIGRLSFEYSFPWAQFGNSTDTKRFPRIDEVEEVLNQPK